jgi:hypothetical protein
MSVSSCEGSRKSGAGDPTSGIWLIGILQREHSTMAGWVSAPVALIVRHSRAGDQSADPCHQMVDRAMGPRTRVVESRHTPPLRRMFGDERRRCEYRLQRRRFG